LKQLQLTVGAMLGYLIDLKMQKSGYSLIEFFT
jgi:F0F1-type ATP synthase assembly protein I